MTSYADIFFPSKRDLAAVALAVALAASGECLLSGTAVAAELPAFGTEETALIGEYSYKVMKYERKKDGKKPDVVKISLSVSNASGIVSGKMPPVALVDASGKDFAPKDALPELSRGSSVITPLGFEVPSGGTYRLRVGGDETGLSQAFINVETVPDKKRGASEELLMAAESGDEKWLRGALSKGAGIDAKNGEGETALMLAVRNEKVPLVRLIIERKADLGKANVRGETALFYAVDADNFEIAKLLLDAGADPKAASASGETPLKRAKKKKAALLVNLIEMHTERNLHSLRERMGER